MPARVSPAPTTPAPYQLSDTLANQLLVSQTSAGHVAQHVNEPSGVLLFALVVAEVLLVKMAAEVERH